MMPHDTIIRKVVRKIEYIGIFHLEGSKGCLLHELQRTKMLDFTQIIIQIYLSIYARAPLMLNIRIDTG